MQPGLPDETEGGAARCGSQTGIAEVGMVENIEDLRAELRTDGLPDRRVLEHGKVDVMKRRPGNGIPPEVAEVQNAASIHKAHRNPEGGTRRTIRGIGRIAHAV